MRALGVIEPTAQLGVDRAATPSSPIMSGLGRHGPRSRSNDAAASTHLNICQLQLDMPDGGLDAGLHDIRHGLQAQGVNVGLLACNRTGQW